MRSVFGVLLLLMLSSTYLQGGFLDIWFGGGGSSAGSSDDPYELIIGGSSRDDDEPTTYYRFFNAVDQNVTVHIFDHRSSSWFVNRDLTLRLYSTDTQGACTTNMLSQSPSQDGNFDWGMGELEGGAFYCFRVTGRSSYDISLSGDAALALSISDATANEDDGQILFNIAASKALPNSVNISYTLSDATAKSGINYVGSSGSITMEQGSSSATIAVALIDTDMSTSKEFDITISSSDIALYNDTATGVIQPSRSIGEDGDYQGPDICYDKQERRGFCFFGTCIFYKETTTVRAMRSGLSNIQVAKGMTRGLAFMDFASEIGINGNKKTLQIDGDEAEKGDFSGWSIFNSSLFNGNLFPKGLLYKLGSLDAMQQASYYDKSLFKFGLFTQYTHIVSYDRAGSSNIEVLQACNPDSVVLESRPNILQCGLFVDALNAMDKIKLEAAQTVNIQGSRGGELAALELDLSGASAQCDGQTCQADGIGASALMLPSFRASLDSNSIAIPYSLVVSKQQVGRLYTTTDANTQPSENERVILFVAPYSPSYGGRVMFVDSIGDSDAHASSYRYIFKEGDYWIGSWSIDKPRDITIEARGNVRLFIGGDFDISAANITIGQGSGDASVKLWLFSYGTTTLLSTQAITFKNSYIYSKGSLYIESGQDTTMEYGALSSGANLTLKSTQGASLVYSNGGSASVVFKSCGSGGGGYMVGPFGAWDTFRDDASTPPPDRNISTKIVAKPFSLSLASLNKAGDSYELKSGSGAIEVAIYDEEQMRRISNAISFDPTATMHVANSAPLVVNQASKKAAVGFRLCSSYEMNSTTGEIGYLLHPPSVCAGTPKQPCSQMAVGAPPSWHICYASDRFAIRPKRFEIVLDPTPKRAAEPFAIGFEALDYNDVPTSEYNESVGGSFVLTLSDAKPTCLSGGFEPDINASLSFSDGNVSTSASYLEVGRVHLGIVEQEGSEFAKIDADDTPKSQRLIEPKQRTFVTLAHHFDINATLDLDDGNFTYLSSDLNHSLRLKLDIAAKSATGGLLLNYNDACYAQESDYNLTYEIPTIAPSDALSALIYKEQNQTSNTMRPIDGQIYLEGLASSYFAKEHPAVAQLELAINFNRAANRVLNPFVLHLDTLRVVDANGTQGSVSVARDAPFYYARAHIANSRIQGGSGSAKGFYEVYCRGSSCASLLDPIEASAHSDDPRWWINPKHKKSSHGSISDVAQKGASDVNATIRTVDDANVTTVDLVYLGSSYPYRAIMRYSPSSWLIYNRYDKDATHNEFRLQFESDSGEWSGRDSSRSSIKAQSAHSKRILQW